MLSMRFSWHPAKAESNLRKHGISFETAASAFADPFALSVHDRIEGGEQRWQTLGLAIGRASCRERGCQSVSIWVVAGQLQKQPRTRDRYNRSKISQPYKE